MLTLAANITQTASRCVAMVAKLWLDSHCLGEGFSELDDAFWRWLMSWCPTTNQTPSFRVWSRPVWDPIMLFALHHWLIDLRNHSDQIFNVYHNNITEAECGCMLWKWHSYWSTVIDQQLLINWKPGGGNTQTRGGKRCWFRVHQDRSVFSLAQVSSGRSCACASWVWCSTLT